MSDFSPEDRLRFEQLLLPHVDNAYNLARWLLRSRADAEDVAQEALLRACRFFGSFHGGDARAWLLQIVRNTCYTWMEKNRPMELSVEFDEDLHLQTCPTPETIAIAGDDRERLTRALEMLPPRFREILILREIEGCSYKEIAAITSIPSNSGSSLGIVSNSDTLFANILLPQFAHYFPAISPRLRVQGKMHNRPRSWFPLSLGKTEEIIDE